MYCFQNHIEALSCVWSRKQQMAMRHKAYSYLQGTWWCRYWGVLSQLQGCQHFSWRLFSTNHGKWLLKLSSEDSEPRAIVTFRCSSSNRTGNQTHCWDSPLSSSDREWPISAFLAYIWPGQQGPWNWKALALRFLIAPSGLATHCPASSHPWIGNMIPTTTSCSSSSILGASTCNGSPWSRDRSQATMLNVVLTPYSLAPAFILCIHSDLKSRFFCLLSL